MKTSAVVSFLVLLFFLTNKVVFADVIINEVFPNPSGSTSEPNEFIELYNKESSPVDITNWTISDTTGSTKTYTIPATTLNPGSFIYFRKETTVIALNNTGDGVELRNTSGTLIDSMSFDNAIEDRSWSRIPDGTGGFINDTNPTEGTPNSPAPTSTPIQTPTDAPASTPTSAPASTPTNTPIPTQASSQTTTVKPTPTPTKVPTPSPRLEGDVLAKQTANKPLLPLEAPIASASPTPTTLVAGFFQENLPKFFIIGGGMLFLAAIGLFYFTEGQKKGIFDEPDNTDN